MKDSCPFCGSTTNPDSREHWLPRAWGKYFPTATVMVRREMARGGTPVPSMQDHGPFDQQFPGICRVCNGGWLAELDRAAETPAIDLGVRRRDRISPDEVLPLASSLYRAALMRTWGDRHLHSFPRGRFSEFHDLRHPPYRGVSILLGRTEDGFLYVGGQNAQLTVDDFEDLPVHIVSWGTIGFLFVIVVVGEVGLEAVADAIAKRVKRGANGAVVQLWPHPKRGALQLPARVLTPQVAATITQPIALITGSTPVDLTAEPAKWQKRLQKRNGDVFDLVRPAQEAWPPDPPPPGVTP